MELNISDFNVEPTNVLARWIHVFNHCQPGSEIQRAALIRIPVAISTVRAKLNCCFYNSTISVEDFNRTFGYLLSFESNYGLMWDEYYSNRVRDVFARCAPHDLAEHMELLIGKIEARLINSDEVSDIINKIETIDERELTGFIKVTEVRV